MTLRHKWKDKIYFFLFADRSLLNPAYLTYRSLRKDVNNIIPDVDNGIVLDIGCATKPYRNYFKKCKRYIGLDMNPARGQLNIVALGTELPFKTESIDNICSFQVFEHIADTNSLFIEIGRVLKPGGKLLVSLPQQWRLHEEPNDYFRFTKYGIQYLCKKHGFSLNVVKANGGAWAMIGQSVINIFGWSKLFTPIHIVLNLIFGVLDSIWLDEMDTMNYVFLAEKK